MQKLLPERLQFILPHRLEALVALGQQLRLITANNELRFSLWYRKIIEVPILECPAVFYFNASICMIISLRVSELLTKKAKVGIGFVGSRQQVHAKCLKH